MKRKNKINIGLCDQAKKFIDRNVQKTIVKEGNRTLVMPIMELDRRLGNIGDIRLHKYKLENGMFATEFLQCCKDSEEGDTFIFLGLETDSERFIWPYSKIKEETDLRCMN